MKEHLKTNIMDKYQIVVVEDSPSDALFTKIALEEVDQSLNVAWLEDGEEILEFFFPNGTPVSNIDVYNSVKLILLDLNLPKYNGLEVLKKLKNTPETQRIPVVMFSSSEIKSGIEACLKAGAEDYIVKAIDFEDYTSSVKRVVAPRIFI